MGLAEPKRKQRLGYDPQNKTWSDDRNKFGFKMLEKMGWSQGKGLGANEDGQQDHVKVKFKQDALGVGADVRTIDNWMENTGALDDILKSLNKSGPNTNSCSSSMDTKNENDKNDESLNIKEENGVLFGRRLVRRKFIRNKNVSSYDNQDITMILGLNKRNSDKQTSYNVESQNTTPDVTAESAANFDGNNTDTSSYSSKSNKAIANSATNLQVVKGKNVHSYFANKLNGKFSNAKLVYLRGSSSAETTASMDDDKINNKDELDERPSFEMKTTEISLNNNTTSIQESEIKITEKKVKSNDKKVEKNEKKNKDKSEKKEKKKDKKRKLKEMKQEKDHESSKESGYPKKKKKRSE